VSINDSQQDPRVQRTRALLRRALMELVTQKSFASLTIQEVTKRAGVNRSTFYLHFIGLHALLEDCVKDLFGQMRLEIYDKANQTRINNIEEYEPFVECVFQHLQRYMDFYRAMLGKGGDPYFSSLFQDLLAELIFDPMREGFTLSVESELILSFFTAGFTGIAKWWLENNLPLPPQTAAQLVTQELLPAYMKLVKG